jgi:hypothetical protein
VLIGGIYENKINLNSLEISATQQQVQFKMGASDSKLVFKQGIFRLSEDKIIPADDPYWASVSPPGDVSNLVNTILTRPLHSSGSSQSPLKTSSASSPLTIFDGLEIRRWRIWRPSY